MTFTGVELYSDSVDAHGAFTRIATLTPSQSALRGPLRDDRPGDGRYGRLPLRRHRQPDGDLDLGFSPGVHPGHSQSAIAAGLSQPHNPVGQAIVASANYLTAGICLATGQKPASVCASKGVRAAALALGLGVITTGRPGP